MNIILLGPPGSGKGTQAKLLEEKYGFKHMSTGQLIRRAIEAGDEEALKLQKHVEEGGFAPDEYVLNIVENNMSEDGNLFDGFPRDLSQAEALDEMIQVDLVIEIHLSPEEIMKRLLARGRADDAEETIKHRIEVYSDLTEPLLEYYRPRHIAYRVEGQESVEAVFEQICTIIDTARQ